MFLEYFSLGSFRGFPNPVQCAIQRDLTILRGSNLTDTRSLLEGLAVGFPGTPLEIHDFSGTSPNHARTCQFSLSFGPEALEVFQAAAGHSFDLHQDYLLNAEGRLEIVRQYHISLPHQPRLCLRAVHPGHPDLVDLLQLKNQDLNRRLMNSPAAVHGVDRRSNRAIRRVLYEHYQDTLDPREQLLPLVHGDAHLLRDLLLQLLPVTIYRQLPDWSRSERALLANLDREFQRHAENRHGRLKIEHDRRILLLSLPDDDSPEAVKKGRALLRAVADWQQEHQAQVIIATNVLALTQNYPAACRFLETPDDSPARITKKGPARKKAHS